MERLVKGNLLIDQYGNLLRVTDVKWDRDAKRMHYKVTNILMMVDVFGFVTSDCITSGRVRKANKNDVRIRFLLYGPK